MAQDIRPHDRGYDSPGVAYFEKEITPLISGPNQLAIGIVGTAPKGPLGNTIIYNQTQLRKVFGEESMDNLGLLAAKFALQYSRMIIFNRVVSTDAKKGTITSTDGLFKFSTKTLTDKLNGCTIKLEYDKDTGIISYQLISADKSEILERISGFTLDTTAKSFIGDIFNKKSLYLDIEILKDLPDESTGFEPIEVVLDEGNSGINVTNKDIIGKGQSGIKAFESAETVDISTLIIPGWTHDSEVVEELDKITKSRGDVQVIIDPPNELSPQEVVNWANGNGELNLRLDNGWFTVYYPWLKVNVGGKLETVPPSVLVASQWAYNDSVANCWFAPAGYGNDESGRGRGYLAQATDVVVELSKEDRDTLYGAGNVVNPIAKFIGKGIILFGNKTTKRTKFGEAESMMSSLNVRRLCNYIRKMVISKSFNELFNPNDRFTWNNWKLALEPEFRRIQINRGIESFRLVMDETTVSPEDMRNGRMPGIIYVKPIRAVEYIPITFVVTDNDVYFNEGQPFKVGPTEIISDTNI